ncbi:M28 family peptidase [Fulvivirga lutimaris]|uniref:M28 family peptidase n=1 Tax=Fulvivirga lutimaris TaxID=1819566 RepID=UPI0012BBBC61|nr:M28 family peptidase [Fulvivirga lutimaris]MTI39735.1 M28 family peptidase [Fulvivirga lutimaris]
MIKHILLSILLTATLSAFAQSDAELVKATISQSTIKGHVYFLASDELKGRATGSPEIGIAAKYLSTTFQRYGVQPVPGAVDGYFQPMILETVTPATTKKVSAGEKLFEDIVVLGGGNMTESLETVFVEYGTEKDYKKKDVKGKLVIALAGSKDASDLSGAFATSESKSQLAKYKGAAGIIELTSFTEAEWTRLNRYYGRSSTKIKSNDTDNFLHLMVKSDEAGLSALKSNKSADIQIEGSTSTDMPAKNVVGMVEGTDPQLKNEFVIYSAHYDHIGIGKPNAEGDSIYNGARDNAVGVVTVMSAAENIARNPTKRSALFILFTGEEKGLLGSRYYAENPLIPMNQMVYCFNSDNGGYNDTSIATIVGLGRTTAADHIMKACETFDLKAIDDPAGEQGLFDRSDNVNFAAQGVPAPTFSLGFTAFDAEITKYYHQTADNPETLDYDYLYKFFGAYVLACRLIANDPTTPFWTEGDKYYEAGKALYEK